MTRKFLIALTATTALVTAAVLAQTSKSVETATTAAVQLKVSDFKNQEVFTDGGKTTGRVGDVFIADDGQRLAVVDFGSDLGHRQVPLSRFSYEGGRFILEGVSDEQAQSLPAYQEGQAGLRKIEPGSAISIMGWMAASGDASIDVQSAAPQVKVQQSALGIQIEQPPPQVTVHQPSPSVSVRQLQPVIVVRQLPPTITVQQTQPEVIVRMPEPEVNVSMAEPDVRVSVPKPQVQVMQQSAPQIAVNAAEPVLSLIPRGEANVAIQRAQPQVQFERVGEPKVVLNEAVGEARVQYEEMTAAEALQLNPQIQQLATALTTKVQRPALTTDAQSRFLLASQLKGQDVYNAGDQNIGVVDDVLLGEGGKPSLVVEYGGFLGVGAQKVLMPVENFAMRDDRLTIPALSEAELKAQAAWDEKMEGYTAAGADSPIQFPIAK